MSDISFIFPFWFNAGFALIVALPITTVIMLALGIVAYRGRRRNPTRPRTALKWAAVVVGPLWLGGFALGTWILISMVRAQIDASQRYFTLDRSAEIDGVALPAETRVELDETHALRAAELPDDAVVTLRGAKWQGKIEFSEPAHAPNALHGQITEGTLAMAAVLGGIPCRKGSQASFFWGGQLMSCTLSQDTDIAATLLKSDGTPQARKLRCLANDTVKLDGPRFGELGGCRLATPGEFGDIACAARERILISNGHVAACTFARPARFGSIDLPAGAAVTYYGGRPSNFRLPPEGGPIAGFGLSLPAGTEAAFCDRKDMPDRLLVSPAAYVTVGNVKLAGLIEFDCADGRFNSGMLFEDTIIDGKWRQRGERISRDDLRPGTGKGDPG